MYLCLDKCKKVKDWSVKQSNSKLILKLIAKGNRGDNDLSNEKKEKRLYR